MESRYWKEYNWPLLVCVLVLLALGVMSVYSATLNAVAGNGVPLHRLFPGHIVNIVIGLVAMMLVTLFDYRLLSSLTRPLYVVSVGVLGLVLVMGKVSEGAQSWIALGTRTIQPAELAKLVLILTLAAYLARFEDRREEWLIQIGGLVIAAVPLLLVLVQPDLGTAIVIAVMWLMMAWSGGIRWYQLLALVVVALPVGWLGWHKFLDEYQQKRLLTFYFLLTDRSQVDFNDGYNVMQALNAISAGGMFGAGFGHGLFSQGNYIPVQHADFIFAVVSEEMGFFGSVVLIIFEAILLWQALAIAGRAHDLFGRLIAVGVFAMLFVHMVINIGMNLSILPVTGLPLPLISHGGSFMITVLTAIGLLQSVATRHRRITFVD